MLNLVSPLVCRFQMVNDVTCAAVSSCFEIEALVWVSANSVTEREGLLGFFSA